MRLTPTSPDSCHACLIRGNARHVRPCALPRLVPREDCGLPAPLPERDRRNLRSRRRNHFCSTAACRGDQRRRWIADRCGWSLRRCATPRRSGRASRALRIDLARRHEAGIADRGCADTHARRRANPSRTETGVAERRVRLGAVCPACEALRTSAMPDCRASLWTARSAAEAEVRQRRTSVGRAITRIDLDARWNDRSARRLAPDRNEQIAVGPEVRFFRRGTVVRAWPTVASAPLIGAWTAPPSSRRIDEESRDLSARPPEAARPERRPVPAAMELRVEGHVFRRRISGSQRPLRMASTPSCLGDSVRRTIGSLEWQVERSVVVRSDWIWPSVAINCSVIASPTSGAALTDRRAGERPDSGPRARGPCSPVHTISPAISAMSTAAAAANANQSGGVVRRPAAHRTRRRRIERLAKRRLELPDALIAPRRSLSSDALDRRDEGFRQVRTQIAERRALTVGVRARQLLHRAGIDGELGGDEVVTGARRGCRDRSASRRAGRGRFPARGRAACRRGDARRRSSSPVPKSMSTSRPPLRASRSAP